MSRGGVCVALRCERGCDRALARSRLDTADYRRYREKKHNSPALTEHLTTKRIFPKPSIWLNLS